jgi:mono/diheme cytochrome c family protein
VLANPVSVAVLAACTAVCFFRIASAQDQAAIATGEALYDEHCAMCHGESLRSAGAIPDLRQLRADQMDYFKMTVTDGRGQMPTWGGILSDRDMDNLWVYIRAHARSD